MKCLFFIAILWRYYQGETINRYAYFDVKDSEIISLDFKMKLCFLEANPLISANCEKFAVSKGPIVYCMESFDNGENIRDIRLDSNDSFTTDYDEQLKANILTISAYKRKECKELYSFAKK